MADTKRKGERGGEKERDRDRERLEYGIKNC